ncbi:hypothetical protein BDF20DRAFT_358470 [Mycotypha africana]|uniref:uncharacterized protein n=1 Tax=Mycotypha africana TaxID=64632 RepID=UPI0023009E0B|nr:uncharacterized protein BDF20DRAFT_358470 [Mycotypha africana]KAI8983972.1 hypothetical protein BDF20DRAFT_358470 [Mycotypha africana]
MTDQYTVKQQQLFNRPSTPFHSPDSTILRSPSPSHQNHLMPAVPPLPTAKMDAKLQERIRNLESENEKLRASQREKDLKMKEMQQDNMESIHLLEKVNKDLERQVTDLKAISVDAIETISKLKTDWETEKLAYHQQVELLLKDIDLLEIVLEDKMTKNQHLIQKNKQMIEQQYYHHHHHQHHSRRDVLNTPISEDEEEDDNDLLITSKFFETCILCERKGHSLIECHKTFSVIKKEPAKCI